MRKMLLSLISLVFCCSAVFASLLSGEIENSMRGVVNAVMAVSSAQLGSMKPSLQGVWVYDEVPEDGEIRVSFSRSDISSYVSSLTFNTQGRQNWYETLMAISSYSLTPYREKVVSILNRYQFAPGEVIIDGTVLFSLSPESYDFLYGNEGERLSFSAKLSLIMSGSAFPSLILVEGNVAVEEVQDGSFLFSISDMTFNGERMDFPPFSI